ncbi:MAG: hypothetical protein H6737_08640 [Alphaproteobacteria bacterium]|nr:hypothetical protein [Alphaproteobacteria bacterium]
MATSAEALESLRAEKSLTARRLAEEALAADPDDFVAHYVVAEVYWNEDGNLPRALHHFERADRLYTRNKDSLDAEAWRTHWYVLRGKAFVAESMEEADLFLDTVEEYNRLYSPKLAGETGWVLMKEERFAESRAVAEAALASDDEWQQSLGYNVLCALEAKIRNREAAKDACMASLEHGRSTSGDVVVDAYNASTTTIAVFDFETTEALLKESARSGTGRTTSPYNALAALYLSEGRGAEAVGAIQSMQAWRHAQKPPDRAQSRAGADATLAMVLLVAGEADKGMEVIERALKHPDRRAATSTSHGATLGAHTLIHLAMRRLAAERAAEQAALDGFVARTWHWTGSWLPDPAIWEDHTTLGGLLTDRELLERSLAPYEDDGLSPAPWMIGDLVGVLGPGVMQAAVDRGRTLDAFPAVQAYYDAIETEVAWARGQSRTLELAQRALDGLPKEEVLLRARVAALAADHAWGRGDPSSFGLYERALQLDPSSMRRLGLALPATVQDSGSAVDREAAAMLRRSPRLRNDRSGFVVDVNGGRICLISPLGAKLGCHSGDGKGEAYDQARSAVQAFHDGAFALPLGLRLIDMKSLDGTTRLDAEARKDALQQVLGGL